MAPRQSRVGISVGGEAALGADDEDEVAGGMEGSGGGGVAVEGGAVRG